MTSFIRISDIPTDELHLLPIFGLRQQIRKDRRQFRLPANETHEQEADRDAPQDRAQPARAAPAEAFPTELGQFVTDWQLHDEPCPSARFRIDNEKPPGEVLTRGETFDALYVELGGEG
jgi:hypothetical protein